MRATLVFFLITDLDVGLTRARIAAQAKRGSQKQRRNLVEAKKAGFDVFNALSLLDNPLILEDLKFGAGDGFLHYYLYNWRMLCAPLAPTDVGLILM